ncbi:Metal-binding activator 1 [Yarrowia sp. B02]|nr:Metal-binding activator 1 [Yarrowia sp. B02]
MILVQGEKYACLNCIRGHRSSTCDHTNRPLVQVRRRGRPNHACQHRLAVIAEPTCSCGMTAVLVPEHSAAGVKEEDKKPNSSGKKNTKSVGIIRIGAHSKKIIDTSNGKVTVLDTPVNQFLKENPSGNCTCAASGLEPEEYFDRLKQKSSCCAKEEKPSNGCCSNKVKKEEPHVHTPAPQVTPPTNPLPGVDTIYQQVPQNGYQYNSYYQQPYMYNSAYYAGHTVQVSEGNGNGHVGQVGQANGHANGHVNGQVPQNVQVTPGVQGVPQSVPGLPQSQGLAQNQVQNQTNPQHQAIPQQAQNQTVPQTLNQEPQINLQTNSPMFGQIDPSFSQMWKGDSPQQPPQPPVSADSGPEDRLTPEEFFDMYFAPTCSIPGQCGCGDGCQCKGCPTHDSQTELEGVSSGERFTWE